MAGPHLYHAFFGKPDQRLAHRRAAHTEHLRQFLFQRLKARRHIVFQNAPFDLVVGTLGLGDPRSSGLGGAGWRFAGVVAAGFR